MDAFQGILRLIGPNVRMEVDILNYLSTNIHRVGQELGEQVISLSCNKKKSPLGEPTKMAPAIHGYWGLLLFSHQLGIVYPDVCLVKKPGGISFSKFFHKRNEQ